MLARARALYERNALRFQKRKKELIVSDVASFRIAALFRGLREELAKLPARVDLHSSTLEREIEASLTEALRGAKEAAVRAPLPRLDKEGSAEAANYPASLPEGLPLDEVRAYVDQLHADAMELETALEVGELTTRQEAQRRIGTIDSSVVGPLRYWPRRIVARIASALSSEGEASARAILETLIAEEVCRLTAAEKRMCH